MAKAVASWLHCEGLEGIRMIHSELSHGGRDPQTSFIRVLVSFSGLSLLGPSHFSVVHYSLNVQWLPQTHRFEHLAQGAGWWRQTTGAGLDSYNLCLCFQSLLSAFWSPMVRETAAAGSYFCGWITLPDKPFRPWWAETLWNGQSNKYLLS